MVRIVAVKTTAAIVRETRMANVLLRVQTKQTMPARKRNSAVCRRAGIQAKTTEVFHSFQASSRNWRTSTLLRGRDNEEFHCMYSRTHCFAKMLSNAAAILKTRLMNQSVLIAIAEDGVDDDEIEEFERTPPSNDEQDSSESWLVVCLILT